MSLLRRTDNSNSNKSIAEVAVDVGVNVVADAVEIVVVRSETQNGRKELYKFVGSLKQLRVVKR